MDKKSIIGIVLIFVILVVFSLINQPSKEEIEAAQQRRDSIAQVEAQKALELQKMQEQQEMQNTAMAADTAVENQILQEKAEELGVFGVAAVGTEEYTTLENNQVKITFSNKGGRIYSVELKDYQRYDSTKLILFDGPETKFGLNFFAQNRSISTDNLFFKQVDGAKNIVVNGPEVPKGDEGKIKFNTENPGEKESVAFRLEVAPGRFIEYVYTLSYNSFLVGFNVNMQEWTATFREINPTLILTGLSIFRVRSTIRDLVKTAIRI